MATLAPTLQIDETNKFDKDLYAKECMLSI